MSLAGKKYVEMKKKKKKYVEMAKVVDHFRSITVFSRITKFFMIH